MQQMFYVCHFRGEFHEVAFFMLMIVESHFHNVQSNICEH